MPSTVLPAVSVEYIHVPVTASVVLQDQAVEMAFLAGDAKPDGTTSWITAAWEGDAASTRSCRVLVGPGQGVQMNPGQWGVWVRVHDTPEVPVRQAGPVTVI